MVTRNAQAQTRAARTAWKALCRERRTERRKAERAAARAERDARREAVADAGLQQALGRPRNRRPRPARWTDFHPDHPTTAYHVIIAGKATTKPASLAELFGVCPATIAHWLERHPPFARALERASAAKFALRHIGRLGRLGIRDRLDPDKVNASARSWRGYTRNGSAIVREPMRNVDAARFERVSRALHARKTLPIERAALAAELAYAGERYDRSAAIERQRLRRDLEDFGGVPVTAALGAIEAGHHSGRAVARALGIAESTLRMWRRQYPEFDRAIREAIAAYRERDHRRDRDRDRDRRDREPERPEPKRAVAPAPRPSKPSTPRPKRIFAGIYAGDADQRLS